MNLIECYERCNSGVVQIFLEKNQQKIGSGFGFLIKGGIITNSHVIRLVNDYTVAIRFGDDDFDAQSKYIRVAINDVLKAESIEDEKDYAFLHMDEPEFEGRYKFTFSEHENIKVGQQVAFLGYPFGMQNLTCHLGNISSFYQKNDVNIYQIDGSVNGGNSGGPLISLETGNVIGIITRTQTGLIEKQFNELLRTLKLNQQALSNAKSIMSIAGIDPVQALIASQAAMEEIAINLKRSANVGIGYAFSSEYVSKHIKKIKIF